MPTRTPLEAQTIGQDAKRLFVAHSPLIRRCIERFSAHARDDGNGRVALGFMPLAPEKYGRLAQLYQCVHDLMVCFYHLHRDQTAETTLEDWINLLQFDAVILRCNQGWKQGVRLPESDETLRSGFEKMAQEVLAFRQSHLKEILTFARQAAEDAVSSGNREAQDLFQSVSDHFFLRQRRLEDAAADEPSARNGLGEQIKLPVSFLSGLLRGAA